MTAPPRPLSVVLRGLRGFLAEDEREGSSLIRHEFGFDLAAYLRQTPGAPVKSLDEIVEKGLYHYSFERGNRFVMEVESLDTDEYREAIARRDEVRQAVIEVMDKHALDALVYPTIRQTAAPIGSPQSGSNCRLTARGESRSYDGSTQSIRRTTLTRMAMGTRETDQPPLWIATSDLPPSPGHPFYARLTTLLDGHHFDRFVEGLCARFYAPVMGRPSLAPGRYFRLLLVGSFEGIDSERGMAWRATDSLAVRSFLRLAVDEAPPDHSTIARTRRLIDLETHRTVFTWVQQRLVEAGRLTGKTIAIDATTLEANAAMRSIVRRDTGESSQAFLAGLATASGVETPTREALARLDRKRKKKTSNTDWTHPHDPDAKVTKMKDGRTHLAHKAEHAVDMETGAIVAVTLHGADVGDTTTIIETAIAATEQVEDAQANVDDPQALDEIVGDKGYHSNQTLIDLDAVGIRSYVSEPDRGRRDWSKAPEAQAPVVSEGGAALRRTAVVSSGVILRKSQTPWLDVDKPLHQPNQLFRNRLSPVIVMPSATTIVASANVLPSSTRATTSSPERSRSWSSRSFVALA